MIKAYTVKIDIMDDDTSDLLAIVECCDAGVAQIIPPKEGIFVTPESWPELERQLRKAIKEVCK